MLLTNQNYVKNLKQFHNDAKMKQQQTLRPAVVLVSASYLFFLAQPKMTIHYNQSNQNSFESFSPSHCVDLLYSNEKQQRIIGYVRWYWECHCGTQVESYCHEKNYPRRS